MWQSRDHARILCKSATSLLIPQRRVFARNLFNKIDAEASVGQQKIASAAHVLITEGSADFFVSF